MRGIITWAVGLAALLAVTFCLPPAWGQLRTQSGALSKHAGITHPKELERRIFQLTNEARHKNGLPTLDPDDGLACKAREKSDDMLKNNYFSHTAPSGKTFQDRLQEEKPASFRTMFKAGENIYMGNRFDYQVDIPTQARLIVDGWMTSPGHRRNMLDPSYTHLGIGVAAHGKECYATQLFGAMKRPGN